MEIDASIFLPYSSEESFTDLFSMENVINITIPAIIDEKNAINIAICLGVAVFIFGFFSYD